MLVSGWQLGLSIVTFSFSQLLMLLKSAIKVVAFRAASTKNLLGVGPIYSSNCYDIWFQTWSNENYISLPHPSPKIRKTAKHKLHKFCNNATWPTWPKEICWSSWSQELKSFHELQQTWFFNPNRVDFWTLGKRNTNPNCPQQTVLMFQKAHNIRSEKPKTQNSVLKEGFWLQHK